MKRKKERKRERERERERERVCVCVLWSKRDVLRGKSFQTNLERAGFGTVKQLVIHK